jgi:hypothetical protein
LRYGLTANSTGIVHLLPKKLLFDLFGTSVYSLRLSAVIFGFAATPLLYWLVRRMAGVGPAVLGTVLLITAPEQLYWSRIENANFAPIAVLGLVTAHVGLWMVQRCSLWALLAAALWMPASRFFYAPGWDIFAYPLVLYGHALLFVRRTWRTLWYAVPLLCMGLAGWIFSVSLVYSYLDRRWQFADPAFIFGAPAWRMHGAPGFRDAGWLDLVQLQAAAMLSKSSEVLAGMAYHDQRMFSQWFQRACALPDHLTVINGGVVVLCALGLGYLLGQFYERRAFALLAWVGLGILPAVMSDEPTTRRLTSMFPALYAVAAVFVAGAVRLIRARANTALAAVASLLVTIAVAAIALTSLASHFKMTTAPIRAQPVIDVTRPLMQSSDLVLSDLEPGIGRLILLANLDRLLEGHPCYRVVEVKEWLRAALELSCSFDSVPYELVVPKERREELQRRFNPRRVAFFFEDTPYNRPHVDLVRRLFPETRVTATSFADRRLLSMHADAEAVRALHAPAVLAPPAVAATVTAPGALLRGVTLAAGAAAATEDSDSDVVVRGGILVPADGWNRLYLAPECPQATLSLDARPVSPEPQPMLAGVHPFEIRIADAAACRLPLELMIQSVDGSEAVPVGPEHFVSPAVAALPEARAPTVSVYPGYGEAKVIAPVTGRPIDLGIDAGGRLTVLTLEEGKWRLTRYDAQGKQELTWFPEVPAGRFVQGIAVAPDGTVIVSAETWVLIDDPSGKRTAAWEMPWAAMAMDVALAPNGDILLALASRNTIAVYSREGRLRGEIAHFAGGPGHFVQPAGLTVSPAGDMVVIQDDGQVLVFTVAEDVLRPQFVRSFHVDFAISPIFARGSALDDTTLLLPDPSTIIPLTYRLTGERLMTSVPARDLTAKNLGRILQFQVTADHVYALEQSRLWAIAR